MFDVTTARQIDYTDSYGIETQVTVFQDRTDKGLWYLVPVPRLRVENGQPVFGLTRYISNDAGIAGSCVFEVELFAPAEAKEAAQKQIPEIKKWGQFTWTGGNATFEYELPVDGKPIGQQVAVTPSLFGSNTARFQVDLETEAQLNTFIEEFQGKGKVAPFSVLYEMGVLTQLLGAEATITFTASAAIDYEREYKKKKDTWGKSHDVLVSVKQNLRSSGAGDVKVKKGAGGTNELVQMVRDWAWSVLEQQVADAIARAQELAIGNQNPISVLSDIDVTYSEDTIVEWSTPVSRFLPRFDAETWEKVYHEVDNRQLMVTFELAGAPVDEDRNPQFSDIEVTVDYPTRKTGNTFKLSLDEGGQTSVTYIAPGEGHFDPNYKYKYTVNFSDGQPAYKSDWIEDSATRVTFRPNRLGIRNVSFIGSGIPFDDDSKNAVNKVFIDFFEKPPEGEKPKLQTKELINNDEAIVFSSTYHVPVTNRYDYRLRYQLVSGDVITVQPDEQFGSDNADQVFVLTPQEHLTSFDIRALSAKTGDGFLEINANAAYYDDQNPSLPKPPNHNWDGWVPKPQPGLATSPTWTFSAQPDPQTAYFQLNGQLIYGDGAVFQLTDLNVPYSRRALIIKDTEELYSVKIFTNQINWEQVKQVTMNIFQLVDSDGAVLADAGEVPKLYAASIAGIHQVTENQNTATRNLSPYAILPPVDDMPVKSLPLYYTLNKLRTSPNVVFYFNADYVMDDGTVRSIKKTKVTSKLQIHLPPVGEEAPGLVHTHVIPVAGDDS